VTQTLGDNKSRGENFKKEPALKHARFEKTLKKRENPITKKPRGGNPTRKKKARSRHGGGMESCEMFRELLTGRGMPG